MPDAPPPRALVGRRLLALAYDLWPALALCLALSLGFTLAYLGAGHGARENIPPFSAWQWALWLACWGVVGLYATWSWGHGGQTLGMRPWRLRLVAPDGTAPSRLALWRRYAMGTLSLLAGGAGFWWAWLDPQRLAWHDRFSRTRLRLEPAARGGGKAG
ncbi:RDD family protein [Xanthomonas massiliensis]|uniref:RDD family protein n=1 Tax=Xanthomonas massiliensis TaxID=1720302 RepID=UPI00098EB140|nr:RDD family protein [Xanthomonas massiliensis]